MKNRRNISTIIITLLVVVMASELLLLHQYFRMKYKLSGLAHIQELFAKVKQKQERIEKEIKIEGKSIMDFPGFSASTTENLNSKYQIVLYFSWEDCGYCISNELATWNRFSEATDPRICEVIAVAEKEYEQKKNFIQTRFNILQIPDLRQKLVNTGIKHTPAILFTDVKSKCILYANLSTPDHLSAFDGFLNKIKAIINTRSDGN